MLVASSALSGVHGVRVVPRLPEVGAAEHVTSKADILGRWWTRKGSMYRIDRFRGIRILYDHGGQATSPTDVTASINVSGPATQLSACLDTSRLRDY